MAHAVRVAARQGAASIIRRLGLVATALSIHGAVNAQSIGGHPLPQPAPADQTRIRDKPEAEHLVHVLDPVRERMADDGVDLLLEYTGEAATVVDGGNRKGAAYAGQVHLRVDLDLAKLAGLPATSVHVAVVNRHGQSGSLLYLGDGLNLTQEIFGGTDNAAVHLAYAYGELSLLDGRVDLEAGRLPVSSDFAISPLYCAYLTTLVCTPHGVAGDPGYSFFPNSTWGGRLRVAPLSGSYFQGGVYQVRPRFGGRSGLNFGSSGQTGTYYPLEAGWLPQFGPDRLPGHYKLGFARDTSSYDDVFADEDGGSFLLSGRAPERHGGRSTFYGMFDQMLARTGPGPTDGVVLLGGVVQYDEDRSLVSQVAFLGLEAKGLVKSRPDDAINLLVGRTDVSDALARTQRLQRDGGLPLAGGAPGVQTSEYVFEANYDLHVRSGLHVTPDLQYVQRPGGTDANRSAFVAALRVALIL